MIKQETWHHYAHILLRALAVVTILDCLLAGLSSSYYRMGRELGFRELLDGWDLASSILLPIIALVFVLITRKHNSEMRKFFVDFAFGMSWFVVLWVGSLFAWLTGGFPWL